MLVVRMHLWKSSGCYAYECCVSLLEVVRIGEARHVHSWGNPNGVNPDENVCHVSSGDVCHVLSGGGVPTPTIKPFSNSYTLHHYNNLIVNVLMSWNPYI